jgi:hypothetical protein
MKQHPTMLDMMKINCKKQKQQKASEFQNLDTKEFLRNQQGMKILEGYNLINGAKL